MKLLIVMLNLSALFSMANASVDFIKKFIGQTDALEPSVVFGGGDHSGACRGKGEQMGVRAVGIERI